MRKAAKGYRFIPGWSRRLRTLLSWSMEKNNFLFLPKSCLEKVKGMERGRAWWGGDTGNRRGAGKDMVLWGSWRWAVVQAGCCTTVRQREDLSAVDVRGSFKSLIVLFILFISTSGPKHCFLKIALIWAVRQERIKPVIWRLLIAMHLSNG